MNKNFTEFVLRHFGVFLYFTLSNIFCLALFSKININQDFILSIKYAKASSISAIFLTLLAFLIVFLMSKKFALNKLGGGYFKAFNNL